MEASRQTYSELDSPHINAPVWPWTVAGWGLAAFFVLFFLMAWSWS